MKRRDAIRGISEVAHDLDLENRLYVVTVMCNYAESGEELEAMSREVEAAKKRKSIQDTRNMKMLTPVVSGFVQPRFWGGLFVLQIACLEPLSHKTCPRSWSPIKVP